LIGKPSGPNRVTCADPDPLVSALAARCRALLASGDQVADEFALALGFHERDPDSFATARTRLCFGEWLRRRGRRIDAREHLHAALALRDVQGCAMMHSVRMHGERDPGQTADEANLGQLMREGRLDEALGMLHQAFERRQTPEVARGLAEFYALRGNWDKSEHFARTWIAIDPRSDAARLLLVIVLTVLGRPADAVHEAGVATSVNPTSSLAWAALSYAGLPTRSPPKGRRVNVDQSRQAAQRCVELDRDRLLSQAIYGLIWFAVNEPEPHLPARQPDPDPLSVDAVRWLATAEHSLGFDGAALFLYGLVLAVEPRDQLALARAVQLARANTTFSGLLVSNPWVIAFLPAQLGISNLYHYARGYADRRQLPGRVAETLRTDILRRRAHSAIRPLLGVALPAAGAYWVYQGQIEANGGKVIGGYALACSGIWLLGSWIYARWRLRFRRRQHADLSPHLVEALGRDTLPLKARSLAWPLAAALLGWLGGFFVYMGFTDADPTNRPLGLIAGPYMLGVSIWVMTRWLVLRWRLRHLSAVRRA
jgi:tetratricopeptide (TPR) repeat protein